MGIRFQRGKSGFPPLVCGQSIKGLRGRDGAARTTGGRIQAKARRARTAFGPLLFQARRVANGAFGQLGYGSCGRTFVPALTHTHSQRNVKDILYSYLLATQFDPNWYKAWHTWALANFEVVNHLLNQAEVKAADVMGTTLVPHIIPAVQGNFHLCVHVTLTNA